MSKLYEYNECNYYGGDSKSRSSSMDEYLEDTRIFVKKPNVFDDFYQIPQAHLNKPAKYEGRHHIDTLHADRHHHNPEIHKKVHFSEVDIDRKGKHEVYEERTIDVEADGFIQKRHKNFESCNTFNGY